MTTSRRTAAFWAVLFTIEAVATLGVVGFNPPPPFANSQIEWDPGYTYFLSSGLAYVNTSSPLYFTQSTQVGATWLLLDNTNLSIQKLPASGNAPVSVTITQMSFGTVVPTTPAFTFIASAPSGATVWFNISNLVNGMPYTLKVDNATNKLTAAQTTGELDLSWSDWSTHQFEIDVTASYNQAPGSVSFTCDSAPVFPFVTRLHCAAPPGSNATGWEWQANGRVVGQGGSMDHYLPGMGLGASTVVVDLVGYRPNGTFPQIVGAQIVPVDLTQASAIGWGTVVVLTILALLALSGRRSLPDPHNPTYRESAIKVSFFPERSANPGWVSYRQRPLRYTRYVSRHRNGLWTVYGIKAGGGSEIQTVREPLEDAPPEWVRRALQHAPAGRREQIAENLKRRGVL